MSLFNNPSKPAAVRPPELSAAERRAAAIERAEREFGVKLVSLGEVQRQVKGVGRNAPDRTVRAELFATTKFNGKSFVRYEEYPDQCIAQFETVNHEEPESKPPLIVSRASLAAPSGFHPEAADVVTTAPINTPVTW